MKITPLAALFSAVLLASPALVAQTITIDSVPPYGTPGYMRGTVTGVNFATHQVAAYIGIEGGGTWSKPNVVNRTVPINPDGTFIAQVYGCCLDARATLYTAALLPNGVTPPLAAGNVCSQSGC